ncbi:hypothetical protein DPMN_174620 [Dreissena polymorpha]|uniref:Uncharacterized protein n=1 Tax=Dreissena polymorpha TaxID=45954 RepID=A0A9D4E3Q2_DREPO|nr:hypothetical protein DPMN_174620 [Dreissena polymorpha]
MTVLIDTLFMLRQNGSIFFPAFFNWEDAAVYFPDTAKLAEYVLNDSGCMFTGTDRQIGAIPWFYGQVIDASGGRLVG